jgi:hypothetical protein
MRRKKATPYGKRRLKEGLSIVTRFWNVTNEEVLGKSRYRHIMNARHSLRYYLCMSNDLPLAEIACLTNGDHSVIIHSKKMFDTLCLYDPEFRQMKNIFIGEVRHEHKVSRRVKIEEILISALPIREKRIKIEGLYEN